MAVETLPPVSVDDLAVIESAAGDIAPGTQALWRGLQILSLVSTAGRPPRFVELLDRSELSKGTLHRLLQTLMEARFVAFDERDQTYRLGSRLFEMAHHVWDNFDLRGAAEPELIRLRDLTGETVRLGILDGDDVLYIDQREAPQPLRLANSVGNRASPHTSGIGKAILAHLDPERRMRLLQQDLVALTPRTITDPAELMRQLDLTKGRGYAIAVEEQNAGISSVAAPILDHRARPIGGIGIVGPSFRLTEERLHALGRETMIAARRISGNVGESAMSITVNPRPLGSDSDQVRCAVPASSFLGEGPHWSVERQRLIWVDILAPAVLESDVVSGTYISTAMPHLVGTAIPRATGGLVAAMQGDVRLIDAASDAMTILCAPEQNRPGNRFNDGKCDSRGRLWVGSLAIDATPGQGALWRIDPDGSATLMQDGVHIANGLGWSPDDRTFYFTDSGKRTIYAYDFDVDRGAIAGRRVFAEIPEGAGIPDGLTVDAEGFVWSAHWDGWCVTRYDPDGKVERVVNLPVPRPTSCVFGGDDLATLFVTSARIRLSAQQLAEAPQSGSVFAVATGFTGLAAHAFAG
ncbi:MAG: SMP-30/gluconolactonase/LRE family protein [Inquilinaceae bacterium]